MRWKRCVGDAATRGMDCWLKFKRRFSTSRSDEAGIALDWATKAMLAMRYVPALSDADARAHAAAIEAVRVHRR